MRRLSSYSHFVANVVENQRGVKMGINYKELMKKTDEQKYKNIYDRIPFIRGKDKREQMWWIRLYRLRTIWMKHYDEPFPADGFVDKIIFNAGLHEDVRGPNPWDQPNYKHGWLGHNHSVNFILLDVEGRMDDDLIKHERYPLFDIEFPEVKTIV